jgi:hypothetical protein
MDLSLTTPALLFPAVSLLLLAYTNRFLALATLIRNLHATYKTNPDQVLLKQINNLRHRVTLIKNMQAVGIWSLFLCVLCMFVLFAGQYELGKYIFGISIILLMWSLALSIREIQISVNALNLHLSDIEKSN